MIDPEDVTPPHGTPIPSARPEPARARPGHAAPRVPGGELPEIPPTVGAVLEKARALFRVARHPYGDPLWPHLRPELVSVRRYLVTLLRAEPDRDDVAILLEEVSAWLGGRVA